MSKHDELICIDKAIDQAQDFIEKAENLRRYLGTQSISYQSKFRSSARRSSMDLSRLLAEFRKPK